MDPYRAAFRFHDAPLSFDLQEVFTGGRERNVEILLCVAGSGEIRATDGQTLALGRGASVLIPAAVAGYEMRGALTVYKATVSRR